MLGALGKRLYHARQVAFSLRGIVTSFVRSLLDKVSEVKSLRDFGCSGKLADDQTTAIQRGFTWLAGSIYRKLVGVDGDVYRLSAKINVDGSYLNFEGNNCAFLNAISANPADPAFELNDVATVFAKFANFRLYPVAAATKGHGFSIIGTGLVPQAITFDNVRIDQHVGNGKDSAGAAMDAFGVYVKNGQTVNLHNCYIQDGSGGVRAEDTFKIHLWNTVIDGCVHQGIYAKTVDNVTVDGLSIVNGCGQTGEGAVYFDAVSSFSFVNSRIKGGGGNLIRSGDSAGPNSRGVTIAFNQLEHTDELNQGIRLTTAVLNPRIVGNVIKCIPDTGTTQTAAIEIVDVGAGGQISKSGVIEGNYIYAVGANTLTDAIKLNSTLNSVNVWSIKSNKIGPETGDNIAAVITNGINLAGNGTGNRVEDNTFGAGAGGSVTNGIVIGAGHTSTIVDNNRDDGGVGTMITNNGVRSRIRQDGTWVPSLTFATPGNVAVGAYAIRYATYTQNDNYGEVTFNIDIAAGQYTQTTSAGNLRITGSPFTPENVNSFPPGSLYFTGITKAGYTQFVPYATPNQSYIEFQASGSGVADAPVVVANVPSAGAVRLFGSMRFRLK